MRRTLLLAPLATLAACVAPQPAPLLPTPAPPPATTPPPAPRAVAWEDGPASPGTWTWTNDAQGSVATFGVPGQAATFAVRCDRASRRITLTSAGTAAPDATLTIQTSDGSRAFPASATAPGIASTTTPATDGFLDRIAFSRGRFRTQLTNQAAVVIPAWPEFARTIEDCRP